LSAVARFAPLAKAHTPAEIVSAFRRNRRIRNIFPGERARAQFLPTFKSANGKESNKNTLKNFVLTPALGKKKKKNKKGKGKKRTGEKKRKKKREGQRGFSNVSIFS